MHLIVEGYGGEIRDTQLIYEFLNNCPDQINMVKISTPQVSAYEGTTSDERGISGFILLAESHISIHVLPGKSSLNIDLFSCKGFNPEQIIKAVRERFGLTEIRSYLLNRPEAGIEVSRH